MPTPKNQNQPPDLKKQTHPVDRAEWNPKPLATRKRNTFIMRTLMVIALYCTVSFLFILIGSILNNAFGYVIFAYEVHPTEIAATQSIQDLSKEKKIAILKEHLRERVYATLDRKKAMERRSDTDLSMIIFTRVLKASVVEAYSVLESLFQRKEIFATLAEHANADLSYRSWITARFIAGEQSTNPLETGIKGAIIGSLFVILVTILFSLPLGIGSAVYICEYMPSSRWKNLLQINIYNLSGIPSIIYGLLGLVIFVRIMVPLTSGQLFGFGAGSTESGRTILSAGLTLTLLILPVIVINAQEAILAVPSYIKQASYGLGATRWQTVWHHVIPYCMGRILTGTILAVSRAIGETAPLVVVGASTFLTIIPQNIFSKYTALPIQIYQWAARPQQEFQHLAAGAIIILLAIMLLLNSIAIFYRIRLNKNLERV